MRGGPGRLRRHRRDGGRGRAGRLAETSLQSRRAADELIGDLLFHGVHHVYCLHPTFQWNLMFDSGERILARWMDPTDRVPRYPREVDRASFAGEPVAIVGTPDKIEEFRRFLGKIGRAEVDVRVTRAAASG